MFSLAHTLRTALYRMYIYQVRAAQQHLRRVRHARQTAHSVDTRCGAGRIKYPRRARIPTTRGSRCGLHTLLSQPNCLPYALLALSSRLTSAPATARRIIAPVGPFPRRRRTPPAANIRQSAFTCQTTAFWLPAGQRRSPCTNPPFPRAPLSVRRATRRRRYLVHSIEQSAAGQDALR